MSTSCPLPLTTGKADTRRVTNVLRASISGVVGVALTTASTTSAASNHQRHHTHTSSSSSDNQSVNLLNHFSLKLGLTEMAAFAGDMNDHVGRINRRYADVCRGPDLAMEVEMLQVQRVLEFADSLGLVIRNRCFFLIRHLMTMSS